MDERAPERTAPPADGGGLSSPSTVVETSGERLRRRARRARVYAWTAILVLTIVIIVALIAANTSRVKISWVFGDTRERLVWIILVAALVGWVAGIATGVVARRRIRDR